MQANPKKNYVLLGTNSVIDQMKVFGLTRQRSYAERWQELITQATPIFNKLVDMAGNVGELRMYRVWIGVHMIWDGCIVPEREGRCI